MARNQESDELLDLVDENDNVVDQRPRREVYKKYLSNFRVVNAFIANRLGELWIPRRSRHHRSFPLSLDLSIGGHVRSGEEYEAALAREAREELNLDLRSLQCRCLGHLTPHEDNVSAFMKVYEIPLDTAPDYPKTEFVEAFWFKPKDLEMRLIRGEPAKDDLLLLLRSFYVL